MNNLKLNVLETRAAICVIVVCIMQSFAFAQTDSPFYNPSLFLLYAAASFLPTIFIVAAGGRIFMVRIEGVLIASSIIFYWLFEYIHSYGNLNLFSGIFFIFILPFCFLKREIQIKVFCLFHKMLYWMSVFGIIISILYFCNIMQPLSIEDFYDNGDSAIQSYYANYLIGYIQTTDFGLMRFCGLFNEPGLFGTLAALTLIADRIKMTKENITILIACLFTFSAACFLLIMSYIMVRGFITKNKKVIWAFIVLIALFVFFTTIEFENSNLTMFFQRFTLADGELIENNRTSYEFDKLWNQVIKNPEMLMFGYGHALPNLASSTYKIFILKHGLLGSLIIFIPLLLASYKLACKSKYGILLVILFFLSIYQRPQIFNLAYIIILVGGLQYIRYTEMDIITSANRNQ